jgi:hypothetical protein
MHQHKQSGLPPRPRGASARELTHCAMFLGVCKPELDRLATESIQTLGLGGGHSRPVGLDQCLVLASLDGSAAVRIGGSSD